MANENKRGFSINIFLAEGSPSGLRLVEKDNWSGLGIVCPRPRFSESRKRPEFNRAGVYVLLGPSGASDLPVVYIGEGDPVVTRLDSHQREKDFWTVAYFFTAKDRNLNKAHVEYLESRLYDLAKEANRCQLDNGNKPNQPGLSEGDIAFVETFLDEVLLCFPVLGVSIFEKPESRPAKKPQLFLNNKGIKAEGYESENGFIVVKESTAVSKVVASFPTYAKELRDRLLEKGVLAKEGKSLKLTQDYEFSSPSAAAAVMLGASINGRDWWKNKDGKSLKAIQEAATSIKATT